MRRVRVGNLYLYPFTRSERVVGRQPAVRTETEGTQRFHGQIDHSQRDTNGGWQTRGEELRSVCVCL